MITPIFTLNKTERVNPDLLLIAFPVADDEVLHWWHVADGAVQATDCDSDPLLASQAGGAGQGDANIRMIALMPSHHVSIMAHPAISDANESQMRAAAIIAARAQSLEADRVHIVAAIDESGEPVTAAVGQDILASGLVRLQARNIDPDAIIPAGWLLPTGGEMEANAVSADFGFDRVVRAGNIIAVDDPALRKILFAERAVEPIAGDAFGVMLAGAAEKSDLNFRSGPFVKKTQRAIDAKEKRRLGWMAAGLVILSLAIPLAQLAKYHWAAASADEAALVRAAEIVGEQENPEAAERALDQRLIAENRGNIMFPVPASALYAALQQVPNVSITRMAYGDNGIVSATLSAVRNEDINPALLALQDAGFIITATPRTDATGSAQADITVRAP
ncbi:hypothetical protein [Sphingorhabdus sp. 109]|jgi:general secretion pathway protein L|uniref:hypothetical protein n=1 Tax=Sphingorhabdus sp. 109 TaxID=2653173 RepID=UPI0012EF82F1|nr:hypothetical protein [Sphingorhabdus sp. 109]VWX59572.1 conserved hypothetical protein [Sphingorhabdus sp. 109]